VCKYREHTSVAVFALRDVELQQDVAHVRLDSSFAHVNALGDGGVAEAFGDECEHVPFAVGQLDERTFCADWCDEAPDDLWVEPGSALGDPLGRREELVDGQDAVLEQVTKPPSATRAMACVTSVCVVSIFMMIRLGRTEPAAA
jgi:hypothetical protein